MTAQLQSGTAGPQVCVSHSAGDTGGPQVCVSLSVGGAGSVWGCMSWLCVLPGTHQPPAFGALTPSGS